MWMDLSVSEWVNTVFVYALLPAHLASYVLPAQFIVNVFRRYIAKEAFAFDGKEGHRKNFWGTYLVLSGLILLPMYWYDGFMFVQGVSELVCGLAIFVLGPSWWGSGERSKGSKPQSKLGETTRPR